MNFIDKISQTVLPCVMLLCALIIIFGRKKNYFGSFISGAEDGIKTSFGIIPSMCALIVGVSMFQASGACDFLCKMLKPLCVFLNIPSELLPLILTRPLSGSASVAMLENILSQTGADSFPSLCASVIMASSDTVFYVVCIYFSTVKIKKTGYAIPCALFVSAFCIVFSCILVRIFF